MMLDYWTIGYGVIAFLFLFILAPTRSRAEARGSRKGVGLALSLVLAIVWPVTLGVILGFAFLLLITRLVKVEK